VPLQEITTLPIIGNQGGGKWWRILENESYRPYSHPPSSPSFPSSSSCLPPPSASIANQQASKRKQSSDGCDHPSSAPSSLGPKACDPGIHLCSSSSIFCCEEDDRILYQLVTIPSRPSLISARGHECVPIHTCCILLRYCQCQETHTRTDGVERYGNVPALAKTSATAKPTHQSSACSGVQSFLSERLLVPWAYRGFDRRPCRTAFNSRHGTLPPYVLRKFGGRSKDVLEFG